MQAADLQFSDLQAADVLGIRCFVSVGMTQWWLLQLPARERSVHVSEPLRWFLGAGPRHRCNADRGARTIPSRDSDGRHARAPRGWGSRPRRSPTQCGPLVFCGRGRPRTPRHVLVTRKLAPLSLLVWRCHPALLLQLAGSFLGSVVRATLGRGSLAHRSYVLGDSTQFTWCNTPIFK